MMSKLCLPEILQRLFGLDPKEADLRDEDRQMLQWSCGCLASSRHQTI
jgi:hypothetical protein